MTKILACGKVFTGETNKVFSRGAVAVQDNEIIDIDVDSQNPGEELKKKYPEAEYYDLSGHTVLPGLIDSHIHLDLHGMADTFDENFVEDKLRSIRASRAMEDTLFSGFTTVRNCGSVNWIDISVKEAVRRGIINGPRILTSGKILSITSPGSEYFYGLYREADGYDGFKLAAREQLKMGADLLKLMATGAIMNPGGVPGATQPDEKEIKAIVREAKKLNKKVAAHAHGAEGIKNAVRAGVDTIEHGTFADNESHELMVEYGVYLVPTLAPDYFMSKHGKEGGVASFIVDKLKKKREARLEALDRAIETGVKIACGSDAGTPYNYHENNAQELKVLVSEGLLSPGEAIRSATQYSAEACGLLDELGTISQEKKADIIAVDGDPTENIDVLTDKDNIRFVMKDGEIVKDQRSGKHSSISSQSA
ncbi:metal-dependent hydrolase family protein [Natranaerobius thermophilus]|uniref:Amidohydrolase n=1 Tax=Natranaerobius thermophilus (strain ATCC BAA-1301 / DSM 18059 / JW/NM-WN-LF) TaxID=457570 RepID=B2A5T5_NATTJ|nr:amidohydrolase family protein [Natranaerobius thermophilus]ACB84028.1 amidohydrolase [Natranaerobius thermophilus JW/NM-WN-LF]